ncbi:MAG: hypothetical protein ACYCSO_06950 [Cuniculiplasma sp.]
MEIKDQNSFCVYCGSSEIEKIEMEKKDGMEPRSIGVSFKGIGGNYTGGKYNQNTLHLETFFCKTCKKTEAYGTMEPLIMSISYEKHSELFLLIPGSLRELFSTNHLEIHEINSSIISIEKRLRQVIIAFERCGINICRNGKVGGRAKMRVRKIKVDVYLFIENIQNRRYVRIIYDGGVSYCR